MGHIILQSKKITTSMMANEKYDLNWHTFSDHLLENFKHLYSSNQFADVTLVCDDQKQLKAHKFVLGGCSKVFLRILESHPQKHPVIYLKDMNLFYNSCALASFYQDGMDDLLSAANVLEVKEISEGYNIESNDEIVEKDELNFTFKSLLHVQTPNPFYEPYFSF